jgi:DnaJ-class molecular chaperone
MEVAHDHSGAWLIRRSDPMETTFYEVLGVPWNADRAMIDTAYLTRLRQAAHEREPPQVAVEVVLLTRAYTVLIETGRRVAYDHALKHAVMARDGYDATYHITLAAAEARMGTIHVLTFHGPDGQPYDITVPIPPGSRSGDYIRIAGAGGPSVDGTRRGDLVAELIITGTQEIKEVRLLD